MVLKKKLQHTITKLMTWRNTNFQTMLLIENKCFLRIVFIIVSVNIRLFE